MTFLELITKLDKFKEKGRMPPSYFWPSTFALPSNISENIKKMKKWTDSDSLEYEMTIFNFDGELVPTPLFKGESTYVNASHSARLEFDPKSPTLYDKVMIIDGKVVTKKSVKKTQISPKPFVRQVLSFHTHPVHINAEGQETYSFFSPTDINTLIRSQASLMGLACDTLWIVGKSDKTISQIGENGVQMLYNISRQAFQGEKYLDDIIKKEMARWGLVFYRGQFGGRLVRVL